MVLKGFYKSHLNEVEQAGRKVVMTQATDAGGTRSWGKLMEAKRVQEAVASGLKWHFMVEGIWHRT